MATDERFEADRAQIIRNQQLRWKFLLELYRDNREVPAGNIQSVLEKEIGQRIGDVSEQELDRVSTYLVDAGLVELIGMGPLLKITKAGIDEVEEAYLQPDSPTEHLPPLNIVQNVIYGGVHGSTVQQGTADSTQTVDLSQSVDWDRLREILREVRGQSTRLSPEQRDEVLADVDALEAQAHSPRPKAAIVKTCLLSLREVLYSTAGNIAAAPLVEWIQAHHWLIK